MSYPTKKLWEICDIKTWRKDANYWTDDWIYPFFTCSSKILKSPWYSFDTNAILIAWNWDVWACKKYNWKFEAYQRTYVLDNFQWIDKLLLFYFLDWYLRKILVLETLWSAIPYIKLWSLKNRDIPLPPHPTQKLIVQKLDSSFEKIDKSIELTKKNLENIEELNKSVLEKVFSEWEYEEIWKLLEKTSNWNPKSIWNDFFEYIDISSIDNKNYILTETKKIKWNDAPSRAKQLVIENDIIFATTRPNLKNIAIIDIDIKNLTSSTWFCVLRNKKEKLYYKFLYFYIITDIFLEKLTPCIRWAQYPAISDKDLKSLKIPLPPLQKQKEIVTYLDQVFEKNKELKTKYDEQLKELEELKQSLLKEAFEWRLVKE